MADTHDTAGLKWTMDVSAATKALDELKKAIVGTGEAAKETKEEQKNWLTGLGEGIEKAADGFNDLVEAGGTLMETFEKVSELAHFAAEMKNLADHVPVKQLQMMQAATEGAVGKVQLMQFSMRALSGDLHVTEAGLQTVLKAANTLSDQGFGETMEIADKLMDSLRKGSSRELREFGIELADTADKTKNVTRELEKFKELAAKETPVDQGLKDLERVQAGWADLVTDVKAGLGTIAQVAMKWVVQLLDLMPETKGQRRARESWESATEAAGTRFPMLSTPARFTGLEMYSDNTKYPGITSDSTEAVQLGMFEAQRQIEYGRQIAIKQHAFRIEEARDWWAEQYGAQSKLFEGAIESEQHMGSAGSGWNDIWSRIQVSNQAGRGIGGLVDRGLGLLGQTWRRAVPEPESLQDRLERMGTEATAARGTQMRETGLALLGGEAGGIADVVGERAEKMKELEAEIKDKTTLLGGAFDTLSSGLSAAVDAAITGSDNIGKAFMKASAAALKSIAIESSVRALYETAMGIATAYWAPADSAKHFAAAGTFAASAAAAGAGAALLGALGGGGGGGGGPSTPPGGGYASAGGGGAQGTGQTINIYVGDGFVGRPDELALMIRDQLGAGERQGRFEPLGSTGAVSRKR